MTRKFDPNTMEGQVLAENLDLEQATALLLDRDTEASDAKADAYALRKLVVELIQEVPRRTLADVEYADGTTIRLKLSRRNIYDDIELQRLKEFVSEDEWESMLTNPKIPTRKPNMTTIKKELVPRGGESLEIIESATTQGPPELSFEVRT